MIKIRSWEEIASLKEMAIYRLNQTAFVVTVSMNLWVVHLLRHLSLRWWAGTKD